MDSGRDLLVAVEEVDYMAPLDILFQRLDESPPMRDLARRSELEQILIDLARYTAIVMDPPQGFVGDDSLEKLASALRQIGSLISSLHLDEIHTQEMVQQLKSVISSSIVQEIFYPDGIYQALAAAGKTYEMYPSGIDFPKTDQLGFIDHLVDNLGQLVKAEADAIGPLKYYALLLQQRLRYLSRRLVEMPEWRKEQADDAKALVQSITDLAYKLEYVIDSFLAKDIPTWYSMEQLDHILSTLELEATKSQKPTIDDDFVIGFEDEIERMLELLIRGQTSLCIISITGMGGLGKTTLAQKLYRHPSVVGYFHILLQCCVTQVYEKRELLLELLGEVVQHSSIDHNKNDEELADMLYSTLKGRRFLIFFDDIWKIDAWNDLARCLPDDNNGSRIIFTTRLYQLVSQAKSDSILQLIRPLSDDESWELMRNKVFQKESCPLELLEVGMRMVNNCKGLPLFVVLISGLLAKVEKKVDAWEGIASNLDSSILNEPIILGCSAIELSYKHLPDSLKACFLYFGAFLEDRNILVQKLVWLWIAEGFIKHTESKNLEDMAMDYLMDLVERSLVTIVEKKSIGGAKSCRIHDVLRYFCLTKAMEENFLLQINGYDEHFPSSYDNPYHDTHSNYSCSSTSTTYNLYRLSICSKRNHFIMLKPSGPSVRSLLFFASSDMCPNYSYDISFIFHNFKFLKILDLEEINIGDSFETINVLVLLRYLAVQTDVDFIPSSIVNLWNLETFLFKGSSTKVVKVPDSIWDIDKLRHMHVNGCVSFCLEPHRLEKSSILDNLQTFSTPSLAYGDDMLKMLGLLRSIRKLKCIFLDSWDDARDCNQFPELEFLDQLVSLNVFYNGVGLYPCKFNFPFNLKKLTLSNFRMPWSEIPQLAALGNLEVLKMLDNAFEGEIWEMKDDQVFSKLKFLKLESLSVVNWIASGDHFPHLEHLILHKCKQLEGIPPGMGDIFALQTIKVMWCSSSCATSAKKIEDDQWEYGNAIKVHIHHIASDSEASS